MNHLIPELMRYMPNHSTLRLAAQSLLVMFIAAISGCSLLGIKSDSISYLAATDGPVLTDPAQIIRSQGAAFAIPQSQNPSGSDPAVLNSKGTAFKMPAPPALAPASTVASEKPKASLGKPSEPRIVTDANGIPSLKIDGDAALIEKKLLQTLPMAGLNNVNTALLSAGKLDFAYNNTAYTARVSRANISTIVVLQDKNGLMLAPTNALSIFERIILNWKP